KIAKKRKAIVIEGLDIKTKAKEETFQGENQEG
ncbi:IS605 family transposase OrfB, partial [Thermoanaerobacter ethanolicus JW 200]